MAGFLFIFGSFSGFTERVSINNLKASAKHQNPPWRREIFKETRKKGKATQGSPIVVEVRNEEMEGSWRRLKRKKKNEGE